MSGDMYSQQQRLENKLSKSTPRTQSQITPLYHRKQREQIIITGLISHKDNIPQSLTLPNSNTEHIEG